LEDGRDVATYTDLPDKPPYEGGIIGYASPMDNSVQTLSLRDSRNQIRAVAVNFAAHPNSGKKANYVWAEWPGETARRVAEEYGEDVPCLLLQGAAGDVQCTSKMSREQVGRSIAEVAVTIDTRVVKPMAIPVLDWRVETLKIPYCSRVELAKVIAYYRRKKTVTQEDERLVRRLIEFYELWDKEDQVADLPVQCLRIGDVAIVGLPGEPFTALGLDIKRRSPAKQTFVVGYANDWRAAYVAPADQVNRGTYGERPCEARYLVDTAAELMVESALDLLREMWK
jgi:neutral ceramidase